MSTWREYGFHPEDRRRRCDPEPAAGGAFPAFELSTYEYDAVRFPRIDHPTMVEALCGDRAHRRLPVAVHNEDQELVERLIRRSAALAGQTEARSVRPSHPPTAGRDDGGSVEDFRRSACRPARSTYIVAHLSLARGFALAETFRTHGHAGKLPGEAGIQYLCVSEDGSGAALRGGKCNPPFRTAAEVEPTVWAALAEDKIVYALHRSRAVSRWRARRCPTSSLAWRRPRGHAEFCPVDVHTAG